MANEAVLKYLQATNRPYSANDIVQNMHKEFGKTAIQKALDYLVQQGQVIEKIYGKQKVYVVKQEDVGGVSEEELKEMDVFISEASAVLKQKEGEIKSMEAVLKGLQNTVFMSKDQILHEIGQKKADIEKMEEKIKVLSTNAVPVSPGKVKSLKENKDKYMKEYRSTKRLCQDIIDAILSEYPKTKKEFYEEVGLDTEEEANIKIPPKD